MVNLNYLAIIHLHLIIDLTYELALESKMEYEREIKSEGSLYISDRLTKVERSNTRRSISIENVLLDA